MRADHPEAVELSAGMSADLEAAIAAGATLVRVGTAFFGDRPLPCDEDQRTPATRVTPARAPDAPGDPEDGRRDATLRTPAEGEVRWLEPCGGWGSTWGSSRTTTPAATAGTTPASPTIRSTTGGTGGTPMTATTTHYDGEYPAGGYADDGLEAEDAGPVREPEPLPAGARRAAPVGLGSGAGAGPVPARRGSARWQRHAAAGPAGATAASSPSASRSRPSAEPAPAPAPQPYRITTLHPRTYNEARVIGERFRDGMPVIMNLTEMDDADAKRLVDFAAGLSFGLRGSIERVTAKVFLLSPQNVDVTAEDKARIREGGFFNQS